MARKDIVDQWHDYTSKNPFNGERRDMPFTHVDFQTFGLPKSNKWRGMTIGQIYDAISSDQNELADFAKTYQRLDSDPANDLMDYLSEAGNISPREYNEGIGKVLGREYSKDSKYDRKPFPSPAEKKRYYDEDKKMARQEKIGKMVDAYLQFLKDGLGINGEDDEWDTADRLRIAYSYWDDEDVGSKLPFEEVVEAIRSRKGGKR